MAPTGFIRLVEASMANTKVKNPCPSSFGPCISVEGGEKGGESSA